MSNEVGYVKDNHPQGNVKVQGMCIFFLINLLNHYLW